MKSVSTVGSQWGQSSVRTASATVNYWWVKYEEFVGLNEVREAQSKVTEAEKDFMVVRGMVRETHGRLEALQGRLKEVRDRLDRVSREEAHYLELATLEHKLLQEERRLKMAYEDSEQAEREKFGLFSANVRESHEKERARAERTKNWSILGSVLGAVIGVLGSTYINRVRLQELKSLLLEAQKGPADLQEVIRDQVSMHKLQEAELRGLIDSLRTALKDHLDKVPAPVSTSPPSKATSAAGTLRDVLLSTQKTQTFLEGLKPQVQQLEQSVGKVEVELQALRRCVESPVRVVGEPVIRPQEQLLLCDTESVMQSLDQTEKRLEVQMNKTSLYHSVLLYTALVLTVPILGLFFKSN
ncbi:mitochondrial potassium channel isoform X2 [Denticeps clupeoides]|nr:coiled-coil domain-containing protein 51 isoform X2 [Denticeps clupeoides]